MTKPKTYSSKMATITIDGKDYAIEDLSKSAQEQVGSLQFVQSELKRLEGQVAIYKTASAAYSQALQNELNK